MFVGKNALESGTAGPVEPRSSRGGDTCNIIMRSMQMLKSAHLQIRDLATDKRVLAEYLRLVRASKIGLSLVTADVASKTLEPR